MIRFSRHVSVALAATALAVTVTACNPPADKAKPDAKTEEAATDSGPLLAGRPAPSWHTVPEDVRLHEMVPAATAAGPHASLRRPARR